MGDCGHYHLDHIRGVTQQQRLLGRTARSRRPLAHASLGGEISDQADEDACA